MRSLRKGTSPELQEEFRAFVTGSQGHLRRSAYVLCGDWHLAEDLVQTAYQRIFRSWHRVRVIDMPDAYARRVVYHCFLDSRKRQREVASLETLVDRPAVEVDTAARLTILAALAALAPRTRAVVALRYWEDQSVEQTAAVLGISAGTVKSMSARGLAQLRERLGDFAALLPDSVENK
ncbi:MAG: RNA polymerase subunit sigma-24 [Catenulispora sp. 13_1_20CM_3_70_7]|nr:SigE family RNA polymerase sigma factor [Catenulisporales bacterium]OLE20073.1 MAG: RNA polymerase subunit sigma-24 [Catenulispora sp. 13_1_20CM_3_70_7]